MESSDDQAIVDDAAKLAATSWFLRRAKRLGSKSKHREMET
jgi:hypothetical protein